MIHIGNKTENQLSRIQAKKGLGCCCCSFDMLITDISSKQQKLCENFFLNGKYVGSIAIILRWVMITTHADKEK